MNVSVSCAAPGDGDAVGVRVGRGVADGVGVGDRISLAEEPMGVPPGMAGAESAAQAMRNSVRLMKSNARLLVIAFQSPACCLVSRRSRAYRAVPSSPEKSGPQPKGWGPGAEGNANAGLIPVRRWRMGLKILDEGGDREYDET